MFTASGLLVRFLKVFEKSGYQSVKWVRYLSKANGSYQIRVSRIGPHTLCKQRFTCSSDATSRLSCLTQCLDWILTRGGHESAP